jgi:hypothetical protein
MNNNLAHIPVEYVKEFTIDKKGKVTASRRAVARLAGVDEKSIRNILTKIKGADFLGSRYLQSFAGQPFEGADFIPDLLAAAIINYYAHEAGKRCTEEAKDVAFAFHVIGFRSWVHEQLGWKRGGGESRGSLVRDVGKNLRLDLTEATKAYLERHPELSDNERKWIYSNMTDRLYLSVFALKAKQLVEIHGCKKNELRDYFSKRELGVISSVELTAARYIEVHDMHPIEAVKQAIANIEVSNLFAPDYAEAALRIKEQKSAEKMLIE